MARAILRTASRRLGEAYRSEWTLFRREYARVFAVVTLVLIVAAVTGFLYFDANPEKSRQALDSLSKVVLAKVSPRTTGLAMARAIFWNNLRASFISLFLGVVPFACLAAFLPIVNGGALGLLVVAMRQRGLSVPLLFLVDLAPHGIFEIAAWLYASSLGVYFSLNMVRRLLAPRGEPAVLDSTPEQSPPPSSPAGRNEPPLISQVLTSFVRVVVPLLLVAALIETFITPALHKLFIA